jgi:MFS superfamily sulfate permease-like transporter
MTVSAFERAAKYVPILHWLPRYNLKRDFKFDLAAGVTVAMMLIPQEVSLAGIMNVPPQNGLYTAAVAPLVYAIFGSSTVLSVASGSEVSLLVGSALAPIVDEKERIATGILLSFLSGIFLLFIRLTGLSAISDFFSRPVMGGFISAGGFLIMQSQVPNLLSIKITHATYPPQTFYKIWAGIGKTELNGFFLGLISIVFLISLKVIKKKFFPAAVLSDLFEANNTIDEQEKQEEQGLITEILTPPTSHSHGFSLTDDQYQSMQDHRAVTSTILPPPPSTTIIPPPPPSTFTTMPTPTSTKRKLFFYFLARTLCDLGPLIVCVFGGIVGFLLGPNKIKLTGHVPSGFPSPVFPWYGLKNGWIDFNEEKIGRIFGNALTIMIVVYLSSIAMSKRLAIQRGETIDTNAELTGIGLASICCSFFQAMPPTGGMSRTAVNLQNAKTQMASILTWFLIVLCLFFITDVLFYLPKASLAAIIIVAGFSLIEFQEAKWLFAIKKDEFYVWLASFFFTLCLGVVYGLVASILSSIIALMVKTKRPPVCFLAEIQEETNGQCFFVDRDLFPQAKSLKDIIAVRVEGSLYFANCETVVQAIEKEIQQIETKNINTNFHIIGIVVDAFHINDWDATSIQVFSDFQEKLSHEKNKKQFAIANANGRLHDIIASTKLVKKIVGQNAAIKLDQAIQLLRSSNHTNSSTSNNTTSTSSSTKTIEETV